MVLFAIPKSEAEWLRIGLGGAACVLVGLAVNRTTVPLLALRAPAGATYFPHWIEFAVAIASVAAGVLIFTLAARFLPVFHGSEMETP